MVIFKHFYIILNHFRWLALAFLDCVHAFFRKISTLYERKRFARMVFCKSLNALLDCTTCLKHS